jgi:glycosyltransferase involved in cell wall biosynthesis
MTAVFFDCRYLRIDHHDGISRFTAGLFAAVNNLLPVKAIISDERQLQHLPEGIDWVKLNDPTHWSEPFAALRLNRLGAQAVYSPMQTIGSAGRKFKLAVTLHDLIYYRHPTPPPSMPFAVRIGWRLFHLWYWPQRLLLNGADAVVTVSQTTAELIAKHRLTSKPVRVVYNAAGELPDAAPLKRPKKRPSGAQKLVYMGSFMVYKNVQALVRGLASLPGYELHLLSKISPENRARLERLASPEGGKVVFHNGVSESEYHELLAESVALVHGSFDEGFGIPLVEAMSRGIPIVVSDIPIFHEIGGIAALYFDPKQPQEFAKKVFELEDPAEWQRRSELGIETARQFSWAASAEVLANLISQL